MKCKNYGVEVDIYEFLVRRPLWNQTTGYLFSAIAHPYANTVDKLSITALHNGNGYNTGLPLVKSKQGLIFVRVLAEPTIIQGLYSQGCKTYYCEISWSLQAAKLDASSYRSENLQASPQRCCRGAILQSDWKSLTPNVMTLRLIQIMR